MIHLFNVFMFVYFFVMFSILFLTLLLLGKCCFVFVFSSLFLTNTFSLLLGESEAQKPKTFRVTTFYAQKLSGRSARKLSNDKPKKRAFEIIRKIGSRLGNLDSFEIIRKIGSHLEISGQF